MSQAGLRIHSTCHHFPNPCRHSHMNRAACILLAEPQRNSHRSKPRPTLLCPFIIVSFRLSFWAECTSSDICNLPFCNKKLSIPKGQLYINASSQHQCFFKGVFFYISFQATRCSNNKPHGFLHESNRQKPDVAKATIVKKRDDSRYVLLSARWAF